MGTTSRPGLKTISNNAASTKLGSMVMIGSAKALAALEPLCPMSSISPAVAWVWTNTLVLGQPAVVLQVTVNIRSNEKLSRGLDELAVTPPPLKSTYSDGGNRTCGIEGIR